MAHLLKSGAPAHEFTFEDRSKGGRARAAKLRAEATERRRQRRRARYLRDRARSHGSYYETRVVEDYDAIMRPAPTLHGEPAAPAICRQCGRPRVFASVNRCRCANPR